jgi:ribonuclease Z
MTQVPFDRRQFRGGSDLADQAPRTRVVITGTGIPAPLDANRAGAGVLVLTQGLALQFDAGRGTTLRVAGAGIACTDLTAVFLTHHHSDHLFALDDIVLTRWFDQPGPAGHLEVVCPTGPCVRFCLRLLDRWDEDLAIRLANERQPTGPQVNISAFDPSATPAEVWRSGEVSVRAVSVHHEPVRPAVAYRVCTPSGDVAISGDTRVCDEFAELARGAEVVVHEALCAQLLPNDPAWDPIITYHAETEAVGAMAAELGTQVLMLTHLTPPPRSIEDEQRYSDAVRAGGFGGELVVSRDLDAVVISSAGARVEERASRW